MTTTTTTETESTKVEIQKEYKVFVGNLSFKTTKESLKAFAEPIGNIVETTIASRGHRSLGYGFITFSSEAEAEKATTDLDKKELDGRHIHLEIARPKSTQQQEKTKKTPQKKKVLRKPRVSEPSKTILFVANLPYITTSDDLKKLFSAYKLVSAEVSRMKNGCSKGYGFVEFESEEEQAKALESHKDFMLEGRAVYLKKALSGQNTTTLAEDTQKKEEKETTAKKSDDCPEIQDTNESQKIRD